MNKIPKPWEGFKFQNKKLRKLYENCEGQQNYPQEVLNSFFKVMQIIAAVPNESDLYNFRCLRLHPLKGKRKEQHSIRLTASVRLIVKFEEDADSKYLLILNIEDYH